jgi:predicted deacylase
MFRMTLAAVLLTAIALPATAQQPLAIGGQSIAPGTRQHIDLPVPAGTDPATYLPITVFHGSQPGPVLAITAGVHGYEFPPILAAQALLDRIDPRALRGTVVLVRLANVAAFEERTPYVNPIDRKNLNRVFPGRADGTQTERMAWTLTTEVIRRADAHIELHSGDGAEWLEAFVGVYGGPLATEYERARAMALAFGFKNVIRYSMDTQQQIDSGRSLNRQAVADRKPTILVEMGENGRRDPSFVAAIVDGVLNALRALQMLPGAVTAPRDMPRWFDSTVSANATKGGILTPESTTARTIKKGERLGVIRDYRGVLIEEVLSPVDGYALYGLAGPPVKAGETVVTIAIPAKGPL